jgi:hypothetical protein
MLDHASLGHLQNAFLDSVPLRRTVMLRPRPTYLPHPIRMPARLTGVARVRSESYDPSIDEVQYK